MYDAFSNGDFSIRFSDGSAISSFLEPAGNKGQHWYTWDDYKIKAGGLRLSARAAARIIIGKGPQWAVDELSREDWVWDGDEAPYCCERLPEGVGRIPENLGLVWDRVSRVVAASPLGAALGGL